MSIFQVADCDVHVHRLGFRTGVVWGLLIDRWALGGRFWLLPQLLLRFGLRAKAGFCIPRGLGDQGVSKLVLNWMVNILPHPFVGRVGRDLLL
jgi:hypothetical protein